MKTLTTPPPTLIKTPLICPSTDSQFYHVFGRGRRGRSLFCDETDYIVFLALLKQYLRLQRLMDALEHPPTPGASAVQLYAYSLTDTNYQLLVRQPSEPGAIERLMRALTVSYASYYSKKHGTSSPLFNDVYKSTKVADSPQLISLSVAMHRFCGPGWRRSSRTYYETNQVIDWIEVTELLKLCGGRIAYRNLLRAKNLSPVSSRI